MGNKERVEQEIAYLEGLLKCSRKLRDILTRKEWVENQIRVIEERELSENGKIEELEKKITTIYENKGIEKLLREIINHPLWPERKLRSDAKRKRLIDDKNRPGQGYVER